MRLLPAKVASYCNTDSIGLYEHRSALILVTNIKKHAPEM